MSDELTQGQEAENTEANNVETVMDDTQTQDADEAQSSEETAGEAEEVDYTALSERLEKDVKGKQDKIDRQRAALSQTNAKLEDALKQLRELQEAKPSQTELKKPDFGDFDTVDDYDKALDEYTNKLAEKRVFEAEKQAKQKQVQMEREKIMQQKREAFVKAENEYKVDNPDYDRARGVVQEALEDLKPIDPQDQKGLAEFNAFSNELWELAEKIGAPETIHFFGRNNGENVMKLNELRNLRGPMLGYEMAKLEADIKGVKPKAKKAAASKPISKEKGSSGNNTDLSSDLSIDEWMKRRNKQARR